MVAKLLRKTSADPILLSKEKKDGERRETALNSISMQHHLPLFFLANEFECVQLDKSKVV